MSNNLSDPQIWPNQVLPLRVRVDWGVMIMKEFSPFPKTGASPSDSLILYPGHSLVESYPSVEMQSVLSTAPADWAAWQKGLVNACLKLYHHHHHHHLVVPSARISLTLSCHPSLSFIASGRSSGLHPVSARSCCIETI